VTTNPDSTTVTETYNAGGLLTGVAYSASSAADVSYTYDADNLRTGMTDATGTSSYGYNSRGLMTSETNGNGQTIGYGYDGAGQLTSITYPGDDTVTYGYDNAGQMTSLTDWASHETDFTWTDDGQLATQADANGVTQTRTYDADDRTTGISTATSSGTLADYTYGYDDAGDLTTGSTVEPNNTTAVTTSYGYDSLSHLTSVNAGTETTSYTTTPAGSITENTAGSTLAYNTAEQLTSLTPGAGPSTTYGYDSNGDRTSSTVGETETTSAATTSYSYDPAGNLATVGIPATGSGSAETVDYTSDGDGLRQTRTVGTSTKKFLWDTNNQTALLLDDGTYSYLYGPSSAPIAEINDSTGTIHYLGADLIGSTRLITSSTGAVTGVNIYDEYGNLTSHTGSTTSPFGYSGNWTDPDTGLIYLHARDYDPATAQFLTVDPLVDTTNQPYAYVTDDPLAATDALGLCPVNGGPNVPDCTAADYDPILNVLPWLASSQASDVSYGLTHGVTGDVSSALVGLGDGASFGLTATLTQALYPEADCEIRSNAGFYYSGQLAGAIGSTVATAGIGVAGEGAAATQEAAQGVEDSVSLYRSVGQGELDDLQSTGVFRAGANSLEGKFFAESQEDAEAWGSALNNDAGVVRADVPKSIADTLTRFANLDGIGPARFVEPDQLERFNRVMMLRFP
jgi:RHS repeat-associated protein